MNIKKFLGLQTQVEKIKEYRQLQQELYSLNGETQLLADNFALQKSQVDGLSSDIDPEIHLQVMNRFNAFIKQQTKDVAKLCNRKTSIEKSIQNLEKDEEIAELAKDIKDFFRARYSWKRGEISKSVYFDILKAKTGGPVQFADVLLFRGDKLLILQRANDGMYSDKWCIPGGHVDPGETFYEAAVRELYEETGILLDTGCLMECATYKNKEVDIHYFIGHIDDSSPAVVVVDSEEEIGSMWINPSTELDKYEFIFDMKENLENILGLQKPNPMALILKSFKEGQISEKILADIAKSHSDDIRKANNKTYFSHKERKDLAKKGEAMPNGKYPIRNKQDLHDAIRLVGASSLPESEVKAWIKKRARALDLTNELPEDWGKEDVEKAEGVDDAQTLARESLAGETEDVTHPQSDKDQEETLTKGFSVKIDFNDLDQADMFKSLVEEWAAAGKLDIAAISSIDEPIEKAITFTRRTYKEIEEVIPEETNKYSYGQFLINYSENDGNHAEKFADFLGTLAKVTTLGKPFTINLSTKENGDQEWKWKGDLRLNGVTKTENIQKAMEDTLDIEKSVKTEKEAFNLYLNFIEGAKTRLKNIHWGEKDNAKHVYLDSLSDEVGEFEDKIAEAGQSGFGRFEEGQIQGDEIEENDPIKICQMIFDRTVEFRRMLDGKDNYNGEISWIDDFLATLKQTKYRLQMH